MAIGLYVVLYKLLEECTVYSEWWWGGLLVWLLGIWRLTDDTVASQPALSLSMALNHRVMSQPPYLDQLCYDAMNRHTPPIVATAK